MGTTGGITPLQQALQDCLTDNNICDESERGAVEPALDEAIRTDLSSIPQTLNWLYQESKGTVSGPIQRLIEQKLTVTYANQLLAKANDANGLLPDEFAAIYDDGGLQKLMNRFGAGAVNLFLSNVITLASAGTKVYIETDVLAYCEAELIDDGVSKDSITRYKALGITKPEPAKAPVSDTKVTHKKKRPPRETKTEDKNKAVPPPPSPKTETKDEAADAI